MVLIIPKQDKYGDQVHAINLAVDPGVLGEALNKAPSDFKFQRAIINFEIVTDTEKLESIITEFDPPLELWIEYTPADVKCVDGADKLKLATLDQKMENGEKVWKWTLLPYPIPNDKIGLDEKDMYFHIQKIIKWGDRYIIAGS